MEILYVLIGVIVGLMIALEIAKIYESTEDEVERRSDRGHWWEDDNE